MVGWKRMRAAGTLNGAVLLIGHELRLSGASMLLISFANELCNRGRTVVLLINAGSAIEPAAADRLNSGICIFQLHADRKPAALLLSMLRKRQCCECIANTVVTGHFAEMLRKNKFRTVWLIHEMACSCRILHAESLVDEILQTADAVVFPDEAVRESFLNLSRERTSHRNVLMPQGLYKNLQPSADSRETVRKKLAERMGIPEHAVLLTGAGAVNFGKGVDLLVPVLKMLMDQRETAGREYHVMWIGKAATDDPYMIWLNRQIEVAGLADKWHWSGFVNNDTQYADLLRATDIFVLPSREDSYPSAMLEAQHMGIPTLTFDGSGGGVSMALAQHGCVAEASDLLDLCRQVELIASKPEHLMEQVEQHRQKLKQQNSFSEYVENILKLLSY